jgi:transcriptional regulator with XRE-family HTH domain
MVAPPAVPVDDLPGNAPCEKYPYDGAMTLPLHQPRHSAASAFGEHLRSWRQRRRLTQLDLALDADISTRHLSFVETGRAEPSREMVLRLVERLQIPLRERNTLLVAAGYAPMYRERALDDPAMASARAAVERVMHAHMPYPAMAVDRHYTMVAANAAIAPLLAGLDPALLQPPVNVVRLSLHPAGMAPRIENLPQWRKHLLERLRQQIAVTADPVLVALLEEVAAYPAAAQNEAPVPDGEHPPGVLMPLRLRTAGGVLSFISTLTVFGSPNDITLQELAVESFFPADAATAQVLRAATAT